MASLAPPRTAEVAEIVDVDPDNPRNPGSLGHPYGCKPCNKYRPERPNDSCKHAATCSFCHGKEHERPRHRGQRGRHALQRRQFLESRNELNKEIVEIIDRIYEEVNDTTDDLKRQLSDQFTPGSVRWEREVAMIVKKIGKIGDDAQNRWPDNARNRRARAEQLPELSQVDLERRRSWYAGTLHLIVRKMWDENRPEKEKLEEIHKIVDESLGEFKALKEDLAERLGPAGRLEAQVKAAAQDHTWLVEPLKELVEKEAQQQSSQITDFLNQPVWIELKLELLHLRKAAVLTGEQTAMSSASSLDELHQLVKQKVDEDKFHVLAALEEDEEDLAK